jgi:hypothetical protein
VIELADALSAGLGLVRTHVETRSATDAWILNQERSRLTRETADLLALVENMETGAGAQPASQLIGDVLHQICPGLARVDTFIVFQAGPLRSLRSHHSWAGSALSLAVWIPSDQYLSPPLSGILAHEAAHCQPDVSARRRGWNLRRRIRGEALADLFAASGLGPGFAWALSEYLWEIGSRAIDRLSASSTHPPWTVRVSLLDAFNSEIWDGEDVREWFRSLLTPAIRRVGPVSGPDKILLTDHLHDAQSVRLDLRRVKLPEQDVRRARNDLVARSALRPALSFNRTCPR